MSKQYGATLIRAAGAPLASHRHQSHDPLWGSSCSEYDCKRYPRRDLETLDAIETGEVVTKARAPAHWSPKPRSLQQTLRWSVSRDNP